MSTTLANLKRLRQVHGLSQMEIHRQTGINQTRLSRWENGEVADAADAGLKLQALVDKLDAAEAATSDATTPEPTEQGA